jgi:hypothetical protein
LESQVGTLGLILQPFDFGQKLQNLIFVPFSPGLNPKAHFGAINRPKPPLS